MSIERLYPYAGDHAIQSAVFALEFERPMSEDILKALESSATALQKDLPHLQPLHTMALNFEARIDDPRVQAAQRYGGFTLTRAASFPSIQPARQITVNENSILIIIADYSSWSKKIKSDINRYHCAFFPTLKTNGVSLRTIGMQYTDVFNWKANPKELKISEVLREDSNYLSRNIFELENGSLWHSHHGYFVEQTSPVPYKRLDNINVNRIDTEQAHAIQILTSHKAQLKTPIYDFDAESETINSIHDQLHDENKRLLGLIVTDAVAKKIKLKEPN